MIDHSELALEYHSYTTEQLQSLLPYTTDFLHITIEKMIKNKESGREVYPMEEEMLIMVSQAFTHFHSIIKNQDNVDSVVKETSSFTSSTVQLPPTFQPSSPPQSYSPPSPSSSTPPQSSSTPPSTSSPPPPTSSPPPSTSFTPPPSFSPLPESSTPSSGENEGYTTPEQQCLFSTLQVDQIKGKYIIIKTTDYK